MGGYNFENLLAAVSIGVYFHVQDEDINEAVSRYIPDNNRSQLMETSRNRLILDAYNANPTSMEAAIENFSSMQVPHKVAILGKMMELGETSSEEHVRIAELATNSKFERVFLVGENYIQPGIVGAERIFKDVDEAINWFMLHPINQSTILIKGSRANKLERLTEVF
jgi:UDP-N-acetylmuramoyl-tripeptide--D-alanyl-D-alanine ligase